MAKSLRDFKHEIAGKTGTNDNMDACFGCITGTSCRSVGYDTPKDLGEGETGVRWCTYILGFYENSLKE